MTDEPEGAAAEPGAVDRASTVPLYHQVKEIIRAQVLSGQVRPGDRIEGEHTLCRRYGVSRPVVRQALADLAVEGLLDRRKGRGTFVAPVRTSQGLVQTLNGLWEDVHAMGRTLRSDVRQLEVVPADLDVARRLGLPEREPVVRVVRLRFVDEEPWVYTVSHVPLRIAPDLTEQDLTEQSLYLLLRDRYGHHVMRSHRVVEARAADEQLARDLQVPAGDPVLSLVTVSYDQADQPVETFVAFHRGDRSSFEVTLRRADSPAGPGPAVQLVDRHTEGDR